MTTPSNTQNQIYINAQTSLLQQLYTENNAVNKDQYFQVGIIVVFSEGNSPISQGIYTNLAGDLLNANGQSITNLTFASPNKNNTLVSGKAYIALSGLLDWQTANAFQDSDGNYDESLFSFANALFYQVRLDSFEFTFSNNKEDVANLTSINWFSIPMRMWVPGNTSSGNQSGFQAPPNDQTWWVDTLKGLAPNGSNVFYNAANNFLIAASPTTTPFSNSPYAWQSLPIINTNTITVAESLNYYPNQIIRFGQNPGGTLPEPLNTTTNYYVHSYDNKTGDLQVAATLGGTPIEYTTAGSNPLKLTVTVNTPDYKDEVYTSFQTYVSEFITWLPSLPTGNSISNQSPYSISGFFNGAYSQDSTQEIFHNAGFYSYQLYFDASRENIVLIPGTQITDAGVSQVQGILAISVANLTDSIIATNGTYSVYASLSDYAANKPYQYITKFPTTSSSPPTPTTTSSINTGSNNQWGPVFAQLATGFVAGYWREDNSANNTSQFNNSNFWSFFNADGSAKAFSTTTSGLFDPYSKLFANSSNSYGGNFSDMLETSLSLGGPQLTVGENGADNSVYVTLMDITQLPTATAPPYSDINQSFNDFTWSGYQPPVQLVPSELQPTTFDSPPPAYTNSAFGVTIDMSSMVTLNPDQIGYVSFKSSDGNFAGQMEAFKGWGNYEYYAPSPWTHPSSSSSNTFIHIEPNMNISQNQVIRFSAENGGSLPLTLTANTPYYVWNYITSNGKLQVGTSKFDPTKAPLTIGSYTPDGLTATAEMVFTPGQEGIITLSNFPVVQEAGRTRYSYTFYDKEQKQLYETQFYLSTDGNPQSNNEYLPLAQGTTTNPSLAASVSYTPTPLTSSPNYITGLTLAPVAGSTPQLPSQLWDYNTTVLGANSTLPQPWAPLVWTQPTTTNSSYGWPTTNGSTPTQVAPPTSAADYHISSTSLTSGELTFSWLGGPNAVNNPTVNNPIPYTLPDKLISVISGETNKAFALANGTLNFVGASNGITPLTFQADIDGQWAVSTNSKTPLSSGTYKVNFNQTLTDAEGNPLTVGYAGGTPTSPITTSYSTTFKIGSTTDLNFQSNAQGLTLVAPSSSPSSGQWVNVEIDSWQESDNSTYVLYATNAAGELINSDQTEVGSTVTLAEATLAKIGVVVTDSGNLIQEGQASVYLRTNQFLRLAVISGDGNVVEDLPITNEISAVDQGDRAFLSNEAFTLNMNLTNTLSPVTWLATAQRQQDDPIYFFQADSSIRIEASGSCGLTNTLKWVPVEIDPLTGEKSVGGIIAADTDAFRNALKTNALNFALTGGGTGDRFDSSQNLVIKKDGYYAPFLETSQGNTFFIGTSANPGNEAHFRLFGDAVFGIEDLPRNNQSDFDFNDMVVKMSPVA